MNENWETYVTMVIMLEEKLADDPYGHTPEWQEELFFQVEELEDLGEMIYTYTLNYFLATGKRSVPKNHVSVMRRTTAIRKAVFGVQVVYLRNGILAGLDDV